MARANSDAQNTMGTVRSQAYGFFIEHAKLTASPEAVGEILTQVENDLTQLECIGDTTRYTILAAYAEGALGALKVNSSSWGYVVNRYQAHKHRATNGRLKTNWDSHAVSCIDGIVDHVAMEAKKGASVTETFLSAATCYQYSPIIHEVTTELTCAARAMEQNMVLDVIRVKDSTKRLTRLFKEAQMPDKLKLHASYVRGISQIDVHLARFALGTYNGQAKAIESRLRMKHAINPIKCDLGKAKSFLPALHEHTDALVSSIVL